MSGFMTVSKRAGSRRPTPTTPQPPGPGSSSSQTSDAGLSIKAAGKRPLKSPAKGRVTSQPVAARTESQSDGTATPDLPRPSSPPTRLTGSSMDTPESTTQAPPPVAGFVADQPLNRRVPSIIRTRSRNSETSQRPHDLGIALLPPQPTSSVATINTTAQGQFDLETATSEPVVPQPRDVPDQARYGSHPSSSVIVPQLQPTPPNPAPQIPFGRTKSELHLLLDRGKKPFRREDS